MFFNIFQKLISFDFQSFSLHLVVFVTVCFWIYIYRFSFFFIVLTVQYLNFVSTFITALKFSIEKNSFFIIRFWIYIYRFTFLLKFYSSISFFIKRILLSHLLLHRNLNNLNLTKKKRFLSRFLKVKIYWIHSLFSNYFWSRI